MAKRRSADFPKRATCALKVKLKGSLLRSSRFRLSENYPASRVTSIFPR